MQADVRILVVGDLIRDVDVHGVCSRFAQESAGCPVFAETRREERAGGAGAVAVMATGLGATVGLIAGPNDSVKYRHFVDDRQVWRHDLDAPSLTAPEVASLADEVRDELTAVWDAVLIADYGKGACQHAVVRAAIDGATRSGITCLVDPAHGVDWRTYRGATAIKCNRPEWMAASASHAFDWWKELVPNVIVTDGDRGLHHFYGTDCDSYPARAAKLVDVTGCGDMVLAGLGVCLSLGRTWPDACRFANVVASLKAERRGAIAVTLSLPAYLSPHSLLSALPRTPLLSLDEGVV